MSTRDRNVVTTAAVFVVLVLLVGLALSLGFQTIGGLLLAYTLYRAGVVVGYLRTYRAAYERGQDDMHRQISAW